MKVGLIGPRGAGKTTIFNMLTGLNAQTGGFAGKEEVHLGVIKVPDPRIDKLSQIFKPRKTTYAEIRFTDFPPSQGEDNLKSNNAMVAQMRDRKSTRLNSSHLVISYAVFCLKKNKTVQV